MKPLQRDFNNQDKFRNEKTYLSALASKDKLDIVNNPLVPLLYPTVRNSNFVKKRGLWQTQMKQKRKPYSLP